MEEENKPAGTEIDYEKLADAIVRANQRYAEESKLTTRKKEVTMLQNLGVEQAFYEKNKHPTLKEKFLSFNKLVFKILFLRKTDVETHEGALTLIKVSLLAIYGVFRCLFYVMALGLFTNAFVSYADGIFTFVFNWHFIVYSLICVFSARFLRVVSLGLEKLDTADCLTDMFGASISYFTVLIALVAFFRL